MKPLRKFFYIFPAVAISLIYIFLMWITRADAQEILDMFRGVAGLYLLLPIVGSLLLVKGNWWGSFFGMAMGLLMICQDLNDHSMQHIDVEIPLGIVFLACYAFAGFLSKKEK